MGNTPIQWTDHSINPFRARDKETGKVGHFCVKVSPGCKNCYSSKTQKNTAWGFHGHEFLVENREKVELFLDHNKLQEVWARKKPTKYFWCDMTDMFYEDYPDEWIDHCFATMALTPQHTHQVLTKRPERMQKYLSGGTRHTPIIDAMNALAVVPSGIAAIRWPLPNVWLGVSVEDQQRKDRIDILRQTPAAVRFLSIEPLIEYIGMLDLSGISWVIVGGESGPGARRFDLEWMKSIVEQCKAEGVSVFCKQIGSNPYWAGYPLGRAAKGDRKGGDMESWPEFVRVREFPAERRSGE